MARPVSVLKLTEEEKRELQRRISTDTTAKRDHFRARIVLLRSEGMKQKDVADQLGVSLVTVNKWSQRFEREGLDGLCDRAGRGRKSSIPPSIVQEVIGLATQIPPGRMRARSTREIAAKVGISPASVRRIWSANDIKPHRKLMVKALNDPQLEAKLWNIIVACASILQVSPLHDDRNAIEHNEN